MAASFVIRWRHGSGRAHQIGRNLAAERVRHGLTQEQVAHRMGTSMQQYSRMERGEHDSGISKFVHSARAIGMPLDRLFDGIDGDE